MPDIVDVAMGETQKAPFPWLGLVAVIVSSLVFIIAILVPKMAIGHHKRPRGVTQVEAKKDMRFKRVSVEKMEGKYREDEVYVKEDMKTGIKYMYVWDGSGNGGPAICRLWHK